MSLTLEMVITEYMSLALDMVITEHMSLTLGMLITECLLSHVAQSNDTLAAAVSEDVTVGGVKLCCCNHLIQLLHAGWLHVYNVWYTSVKANKVFNKLQPFL
jgi:hypothetical protein